MIGKLDKIFFDNQHYIEILQQSLKQIKDNKSAEQERVANLYDEVIKYLEEKKSETFDNINNKFTSNAEKLGEKLEYFSSKLEEAEELKANILEVMNCNSLQINKVLQKFTKLMTNNLDPIKLNLELTEYKFSHDDESKLIKYLNNFADLKSKNKYIRFTSNVQTRNHTPQTFNENANPIHNNSKLNPDNQFKNLNNLTKSNNTKKKLDSNSTANNKYPNPFKNDILNNSELLSENNEFQGGRINTEKYSNYSKDIPPSDTSYKTSNKNY
jgi:hypothetical protein